MFLHHSVKNVIITKQSCPVNFDNSQSVFECLSVFFMC